MEEILIKAETTQLVPSNVQVIGQNTVTKQLLYNPDGTGKSFFKYKKSLKLH